MSDEPTAFSADVHPSRIVWQLAWPAVALNSLQTLNSLLDGFFLQSLPPDALTAVGASTPILFLFVSLSFMMGTAATALVSRFFGAQDLDQARIANRKCLSLAFYAGLGLSLVILPTAYLASRALVPAADIKAQASVITYLLIFAPALPAINLIQTLAGALRGIGDTKSPMVLSGIQILTHILLNWLLIFPGHKLFGLWIPGANLGLAGAAASLTLSAWAASIGYLFYTKRTRLKSSLEFVPPDLEWTQRILKIAIPGGLLAILRVFSLLALTYVLKLTPEGSVAISAMRIGFSLESLAFMPAFGLSMAAAALVGQSLGMKDPDRASRLAWVAAHHAGVVSTVAALGLGLFAHQIAAFIVPEQPLVAAAAALYIQWICLTETLFGYAMVLIGAMQGAGDTVRPMWISIFSLWLVRLPLAILLAPVMGLGASGCWMAITVSQAVQGLLAMHYFRAGAWKSIKV